MAGTTPRYGFRFPVQGDVVTPTHFKNLADDMDAAYAAVNTKRNKMLKRPTLWISGPSPSTNCAANATTTVALRGTGESVALDSDGMSSLATPTLLTCKTAGVYWLHAESGGISTSVTTLNAFELQIVTAGSLPRTVQHKQNSQSLTGNPSQWHITTVWKLAVNDTVQVRVFWNGTGTTMSPTITVQARCLALI